MKATCHHVAGWRAQINARPSSKAWAKVVRVQGATPVYVMGAHTTYWTSLSVAASTMLMWIW